MKKITSYSLQFSLSILLVLLFACNGFQREKNTIIQSGNKFNLEIIYHGDSTLSFRGIASIFDSIVWVSGNQGTIGQSYDSGSSWSFRQIGGAENLQFRDIELFGPKSALVMSSGSPTKIFKTVDQGHTWVNVFESTDVNVFLDGMDFWNDGEGVCFGDPINGKILIIRSLDYGLTWTYDSINAPESIDGEAGFAASGSSIQCYSDSSVVIGTGGTVSRIHYSSDRGKTWHSQASLLAAGANSKGIFSLSFSDSHAIVVGGDYLNDTLKDQAVSFLDSSRTRHLGQGLPYQSCVVHISGNYYCSSGTPGCFFSDDNGKTWSRFSSESMHTMSVSENGNVIYAAGERGRIAKIFHMRQEE